MAIGGIDSKHNAREWPREGGMSNRDSSDARGPRASKERARQSSANEYDSSDDSWYGSRGRQER